MSCKEISEIIFIGCCYGIKKGSIPAYRMAFYLIILVLLDIADLVLNILGFSKDAQTYYIIRFIGQALFLLFNFSALGFISYYNIHLHLDLLVPLIPFCIMLLLFLASEILSIIFYCIYYNNIFYYPRLGFYIHFSYVIMLLLIFCCDYER